MNDQELLALAERAVTTPLLDAQESLDVLLDALFERGDVEAADHFHHEHEAAVERSTERAKAQKRVQAFKWALTHTGWTPGQSGGFPGEYGSLTYEASLKRAEAMNLDVRYPADDELFLDIDNDVQRKHFNRNIDVLSRYFGIKDTVWTPSKSGPPKYHVVVKLNEPVTSIERIALQAVLGSDPMREMLSLMRVFKNVPHPTLFFETRTGVPEPQFFPMEDTAL